MIAGIFLVLFSWIILFDFNGVYPAATSRWEGGFRECLHNSAIFSTSHIGPTCSDRRI